MTPSNAVLGHGPGAGVPHPTAGTSAPLPLPCYLKGFVFKIKNNYLSFGLLNFNMAAIHARANSLDGEEIHLLFLGGGWGRDRVSL